MPRGRKLSPKRRTERKGERANGETLGHDLIVDSTGDDAVEVFVKIDDGAPEEQWIPERLEPIVRAIRESFRQEGVDLWPYVHFLTRSEEEEARAEAEEADRKKSALDAEQDGPR